MFLNVQCAGKGMPVLFLHGCASDGDFFLEAAEELSDGYRTIRYDRRGYGRSGAPEDGDYSMETQGADAAEVWRGYAGGEKAWVVAHSGGCPVALEMALLAPEAVRGLILAEPAVAYSPEVARPVQEWFGMLSEYRDRGSVARALLAFGKIAAERKKRNAGGSLDGIGAAMDNMQAFLHGEFGAVRDYCPAEERIRAIRVPVIVVVSEEGRNMPFGRAAEDLSRRFGWPLASVAGDHNAPKEHPAEFAGVVRAAVTGRIAGK